MLKVPNWESAKQIGGSEKIKITKLDEGEFKIALKKGQEIIVATSEEIKPLVNPVAQKFSEINLYGVKKGMNFKEIMEYEVPEYTY